PLVLEATGAIPEPVALPARVQCSLCSARAMTVHRDPQRGAWYACASCRVAGDAIDLVMLQQRSSAAAAVEWLRAWLQERGLDPGLAWASPTIVSDYLEHHVSRRIQTRMFWSAVRGRPDPSAEL